MKRPGRGDATRLKAWPNHNHGDPPMVEAASRVSHGSTRYWVDVILTTAWECRRFDREREALAYAQVYARLPNAEAVVAYAYTPKGREIIFDWSEAEHGNPADTRTDR
jgi:hypothetical protein